MRADRIWLICVILELGSWVIAFIIAGGIRTARRRLAGGQCLACGYDCAAILDRVHRCPECGSELSVVQPGDDTEHEASQKHSVRDGIMRAIVLTGFPITLLCMLPYLWQLIDVASYAILPQFCLGTFLYATHRRLLLREAAICALCAFATNLAMWLLTSLIGGYNEYMFMSYALAGGVGALVSVEKHRRALSRELVMQAAEHRRAIAHAYTS